MEQNNLPIVAKKFWKIVRVLYFTLLKGISKRKLIADLRMHMMMKRGKLAGKQALQNLIFHHRHRIAAVSTSTSCRHTPDHHTFSFQVPLDDECDVSCTTSPAYSPSFFKGKDHAPPQIDADMMAAAIEMINSVAASPAPPRFGRSPVVRRVRISDSPLPLGFNVEEDYHVDEAAEEFIMKFYNKLKRQNAMGCS